MRKIILQLAVSLDGFIEGPNGEYDWCFTDQDYGMTAFFARIDAVFYGRKSYELAQSMPEPGDESAFPSLPKLKEYVFSTTMKSVKPDVDIIAYNVEEEVKRIKNGPGKDIWLFGGASLTSSLLNLHLIDEISLAIHPIILGGGKPLFSGVRERLSLCLIETKQYESGLVSLTYSLS